jgi:hypothetical protein
MKRLDEILKAIWPQVRKRHFYPELPAPRCSDSRERVGLDIKAKQIDISAKFVREMSQQLAPEIVLEGLLDHAISHYVYCPWNFATHLNLYREAKQILNDKEMARKATDCFMDVVANTQCVRQTDTPLPKIYNHLHRGNLDEAICALYQQIWGQDLGADKHEEIAAKLARIPYLDRHRWQTSIKRFAMVIHPLLEEEALSGQLKVPNPMGSHNPTQYSVQEIERGLKNFAAALTNPSEFKEIFHDFEEEISRALQRQGQKMGRGRGLPLDADTLYYMKLAENYFLPIRKRPMQKSGSLYPHHHVPWEIGKPFQDIDPWTSFGKIMPGITQMWQRRGGDVFGQEEGTPDCLTIIDSSGSMIDPSKHLSYAVLGAACVCDTYLRNDAKVAVYNFSDTRAGDLKILPYSNNRHAIYGALCHYFGGGTSLSVEDIEVLQTQHVPDIFLITDMQITNSEALIQYFNDCKNRITAVHIGKNKYTEAFRRSMALRPNIGIYAVEKAEDIPRIVLGKVREYLYTS